MSDIRIVSLMLSMALLVNTGCNANVTDTSNEDADAAQRNLTDLRKSALIGLYLAETGVLEEVIADGAALAAQTRRDILFSDMDLSRFAVPDKMALEALLGAKLSTTTSHEGADAIHDDDLSCSISCCSFNFRFESPTIYMKIGSPCIWSAIGSTAACMCRN